MSRSYKKHSFSAWTNARSEKQDKRLANRKFRRLVRELVKKEQEPPRYIREVSEVYGFTKDGRFYFPAAKYPQLLRK